MTVTIELADDQTVKCWTLEVDGPFQRYYDERTFSRTLISDLLRAGARMTSMSKEDAIGPQPKPYPYDAKRCNEAMIRSIG